MQIFIEQKRTEFCHMTSTHMVHRQNIYNIHVHTKKVDIHFNKILR